MGNIQFNGTPEEWDALVKKNKQITMNKEFIPYEQAVELKELGFDEPCFTSYDDEKHLRNPFDYPNSEHHTNRRYIYDTKNFVYNSELTIENFNAAKHLYKQFIAAPLYQQAFRWFRENYPDLDFSVGKIHNDINKYHYHINHEWEFFEGTYEEAELACLKKLIEIVKNK